MLNRHTNTGYFCHTTRGQFTSQVLCRSTGMLVLVGHSSEYRMPSRMRRELRETQDLMKVRMTILVVTLYNPSGSRTTRISSVQYNTVLRHYCTQPPPVPFVTRKLRQTPYIFSFGAENSELKKLPFVGISLFCR